jgi:hypothetical protein
MVPIALRSSMAFPFAIDYGARRLQRAQVRNADLGTFPSGAAEAQNTVVAKHVKGGVGARCAVRTSEAVTGDKVKRAPARVGLGAEAPCAL